MIWSTLPDAGGSARAFSGRTLTLKMTRSLKGPGRDVVMGRVDLEADELQNREILKLRRSADSQVARAARTTARDLGGAD